MPDAGDLPATAEPLRYACRLTALVADRCGGALEAAYLHGSAALGGWVAERSDVDILFVVADDIAEPAVTAAASLLAAPDADCPGPRPGVRRGHGQPGAAASATVAVRPACQPWRRRTARQRTARGRRRTARQRTARGQGLHPAG
ncbi:MAG TPA: hypothetical protein VMU94_08915 [Streptosporangiaceae bacterium]|nr:hypothetical protein [Streptosporangiaceae bacterium]